MLWGSTSIRLTRKERELLRRITGKDPIEVRSVNDLRAFAAERKRYFCTGTYDERVIHALIDIELDRLLATPPCAVRAQGR